MDCKGEGAESDDSPKQRLFVSLANLLYKIELNDRDRKLLQNTLKKNKKMLKSLNVSKKVFDKDYIQKGYAALEFKANNEAVKELENLLKGIWDDDEFVLDVISSVCEVHQEEEMIRFIKESENPTSDVILMYTTDLQQGNIGD